MRAIGTLRECPSWMRPWPLSSAASCAAIGAPVVLLLFAGAPATAAVFSLATAPLTAPLTSTAALVHAIGFDVDHNTSWALAYLLGLIVHVLRESLLYCGLAFVVAALTSVAVRAAFIGVVCHDGPPALPIELAPPLRASATTPNALALAARALDAVNHQRS